MIKEAEAEEFYDSRHNIGCVKSLHNVIFYCN